MITNDDILEALESDWEVQLEEKTNDEIYEESSDDPIFFGLPHTKQYPMPDEKHVKSAIKFFNYVSSEDEEELARNINKQIRNFNMTDINVGDGNRFKKYFRPATESTNVKDYMRSANIKKAKLIYETTKEAASKSLKLRCKESKIDLSLFKFSPSWKSNLFDNTEDLKSGMINMVLFKIDIKEYVKMYNKKFKNDKENKAIYALKNLLSQVTKDIRKSKEVSKIVKFFNVGYKKFGPNTFVYCVEWSFKMDRAKIDAKDFGERVKGYKKEIKKELKKDHEDIRDPHEGQTTDLFGATYNENMDFGIAEVDDAEDSFILNDLDDVSAATETALFSKKDEYFNIYKWKKQPGCNILYITGLSGSGKSTLGWQIAKKYNATYFELDRVTGGIGGWIADEKFNPNGYQNDVTKILNEILKDEEIHVDVKNLKQSEILELRQRRFTKLYNYCKSHSNTLFVWEGIQIFSYFDPAFLKDKPVIIKNTSQLSSLIRAQKRDGEINIENIGKFLKYYREDDRNLDRVRDTMRNEKHPAHRMNAYKYKVSRRDAKTMSDDMTPDMGDTAEDSFILNTAPIVPYQGILRKYKTKIWR